MRKEYFEYLVKWKGHPVEDAAGRSRDPKAWTDRARCHGQEPMKIFK
jgi:hypothetical protein